MKNLINYQDIKYEVDSLSPSASHTLQSLITIYHDCDNSFQLLEDEKNEMNDNVELRISASMLNDAYELIYDVVTTMGMLIIHIGKDEGNGIEAYVDVSDFINPAKDFIPSIIALIHSVSTQMSDFIALHRTFEYTTIDAVNPIKVNEYMNVNRKVSRISTLVYKQTLENYEIIKHGINEIIDHVTHTSMVMESTENVKGKYFVSIISGMSLIEVGESEADVLRKTREYFEGDLDDSITIKPCSQGIYDEITSNHNIPEEWELVSGVVVLPNEKELNERTNKTIELSKNLRKIASDDVRDKIETTCAG